MCYNQKLCLCLVKDRKHWTKQKLDSTVSTHNHDYQSVFPHLDPSWMASDGLRGHLRPKPVFLCFEWFKVEEIVFNTLHYIFEKWHSKQVIVSGNFLSECILLTCLCVVQRGSSLYSIQQPPSATIASNCTVYQNFFFLFYSLQSFFWGNHKFTIRGT